MTPHSLNPDTHGIVSTRAESVLGSGIRRWELTLLLLPQEVRLLPVQRLPVLLSEAVGDRASIRAGESTVASQLSEVLEHPVHRVVLVAKEEPTVDRPRY